MPTKHHMTVDEFYEENFGETPRWAIALSGLRYREGISQASLGEVVGVAQTNISKMEKGKRSIGKVLAKKLAKFFETDYRLFL